MRNFDEVLRAVVGIICALFMLSFMLSLFVIERRQPEFPKVRPYMTALDRTLRGVLAINFALFVLTFIPAFDGIYRLWRNKTLDNFNPTFVWVCASTVFVVIASTPFIVVGGVTETKERHYHKTAIFCLVWLACFLFYFGYMWLHAF